jgi:predicted ATPase
MIRRIEIENFKSVLNGDTVVGGLNLYTGVNGSGKSSVLQTLLLLRQSYIYGSFFRSSTFINLGDDDKLVNLGTFKDILCHRATKEKERLKIRITFDQEFFEYQSVFYNTENRASINIPGTLVTDILAVDRENLFIDKFQYISADRIQPREDYPRPQNESDLGKKGEYTAYYIQKFGEKDIPIKELSYSENPQSYSLVHQLNDWMSEISKSVEVIAKENQTTNRVELSFRYKNSDGIPTQDQKPQNVGYGITHTLPIVVALLSAKVGDLIIIENPETHLHPSAQAKLARLICLAAANGVQVFVETHSDHIINSMRVSVKKGIIKSEEIVLNYFSKNKQLLTKIDRIKIQPGGGLEKWPEGFFDEWENQLTELL